MGMRKRGLLSATAAVVMVAALGGGAILAADRYGVRVPDGLEFAEFRGYENWQVIGVSQSEDTLAVIVGNPAIIEAYRAGIPAEGRHFPDGSKMAKIHWSARKSPDAPAPTIV